MPQPIDLQTGLTQITQAERLQQFVDRAALAAQQRTAQETQEQRIVAETEVRETRAKPDEVEQDLRRHNPYQGRRSHREPEEETPAEGKPRPAADGEEHHFDVII